MWTTSYAAETDLPPEAIWDALHKWSTGIVPQAGGDRHELNGEFAAGSTITSTLAGGDTTLTTDILSVVENRMLAA